MRANLWTQFSGPIDIVLPIILLIAAGAMIYLAAREIRKDIKRVEERR